MNKKAQDLSISTIIIAAIAVIVLVVIVAIFTGRLGAFSNALSSEGDAQRAKDLIVSQCIPSSVIYTNAFGASATEEGKSKYANTLSACTGKLKDQCTSTDCVWAGK